MIEVPSDPSGRHRLFKAIDHAFRVGDFEALDALLGGSRWFDEVMPVELGLGHPLEYAIYWGPIAFIEALIDAGANPNYLDSGGFPAIMATLSTSRSDKLDVIRLLLQQGADPDARGVNDWTPLHYAQHPKRRCYKAASGMGRRPDPQNPDRRLRHCSGGC